MQPAAFMSKKMLPAERNYPVHEQEELAIVCALKEWRHYLGGAKLSVVVLTDHKSLRHLQTQPNLSARQARWTEFLSQFDFEIIYQQGKDNIVADALSRRRDHKNMKNEQVNSVAVSTSGNRNELVEEIKSAYSKDKLCKKLLVKCRSPFRLENGLIMRGEQIYVPFNKRIMTKIIHEAHDIEVAGHVGMNKTLEKISRSFYWPKMHKHIHHYVSSCIKCQENKPSNTLPMGLLQPLPIPERRWQQVTMDFITHLPPTKSGHDCIVVFVDKLSKLAHYVATTTNVTAPQTAKLFFENVVRHHGMPESIVSDRDARFTSIFWQELWKKLGTRLSMSTAYHPQTDGQTERQNRTLEDMLRAYTNYNQDDWDEYLVTAEIAYNDSIQASTGETPFYLNCGQHPKFSPLLAYPNSSRTHNQAVSDMLSQLQLSLKNAKSSLEQAQQRQKQYANESRREVTLSVGDEVMLSTANLRNMVRAPKLYPKFIGPYKVKRVVSSVAYELDLPNTMRIHPTFHISKLKLYTGDEDEFPDREQVVRPPPDIVDDEQEYEVEQIIDKRESGSRTRRKVYYRVLWKGYPRWESTWEDATTLTHAEEAIAAYEAEQAYARSRMRD